MLSMTMVFKPLNNSIYGIIMENLRKKAQFRLVNNAKEYKDGLVEQVLLRRKYLSRNCICYTRD